MSTILGVNAVFHDPAAALVVDGEIVAAAEEERFSRRKHGKDPVPFSTWELPVEAMRWCLSRPASTPPTLDAVAYSYDPDAGAAPLNGAPSITDDGWEGLRTLYVRRVPAVPRHRPARAATRAGRPRRPPRRPRRLGLHRRARRRVSAVLVMDGRGESASHLGGRFTTATSTCSPPSCSPTRSASSTRRSPRTSASAARRTSTR